MPDVSSRRSFSATTRKTPSRRPSYGRARTRTNSKTKRQGNNPNASYGRNRQRDLYVGGSSRRALLRQNKIKYGLLAVLIIIVFIGILFVSGVFPGEASVPTMTEEQSDEQASSDSEQLQSNDTDMPRSFSLEVPALLQNPELPTGCETVSLTDALIYKGFELSKTELVDNWLPTSDYDFVNSFLGSPYDKDGNACMAPAIVTTAQDYLSSQNSDDQVDNLTGRSFQELLQEVSQGNPVLVWCTINMEVPGNCYRLQRENGRTYRLLDNTHCVVLSGYNLDTATVNVSDPLKGQTTYSLRALASRYYALGSQAIVIY